MINQITVRNKNMNMNTAEEIYAGINTTRLADLRLELIKSAVNYARMRTDWELAFSGERQAMNTDRTVCHNAFISSRDILSRNMKAAGEAIEWRRTMGDDRREIGDFACLLHCILGINAR